MTSSNADLGDDVSTIVDACEAANAALVDGRDVILAGFELAGTKRWVEVLRGLGARRVFVLAPNVGNGPLPSRDDADWHVVGLAADGVVGEIRAVKQLLASLPVDARHALDAFDPQHRALVLVPVFLEAGDIDGRPTYGARPESWAALEDKTICDAIFMAAGVRVAEHVVIDAAGDLRAAARALDRGRGTVWSGDATGGFTGGGSHVRWVRTAEHEQRAIEFFAQQGARTRIMAFFDGVACSIHGFVTDDGVAVFRPVEMVVFQRPPDHPEADEFVYAGCATFWDAPRARRDEMREVASRVGAWLAEHAGLRGAFTVDGIATSDGFVPTELNTRFGAALSYATVVVPRLGFQLAHMRAVAGDAAELCAAELEAAILPAAEATRWGSVAAWVTRRFDETVTTHDEAVGEVSIGPSATGGSVRIAPDPALVPVGPPLAPLVARSFARVDAQYGTGIGPLVAAAVADSPH